jgi:hypothetical protein
MKDLHDRIQDITAVLALCFGLFVFYVWTVRCGVLPEPAWFEAVKGPSYPPQP